MNNRITSRSILFSITSLLDYMEIDILDEITNHGRRVAYISLRIGERLGLSKDELFDLGRFAILHDIGGAKSISEQTNSLVDRTLLENYQSHCVYGQTIADFFPSLTNQHDIVLYHHENYDGSGFFGKKDDEIPLMSKLICMSDYLELRYFSKHSKYVPEQIISDLKQQSGILFNPSLVEILENLAREMTFWLDLDNANIDFAIHKHLPAVDDPLSTRDLFTIAEIISATIDSKSIFTNIHSKGLAEKALKVANFCKFSSVKTRQFHLAALLHDIGKLIVSTKILNKNGPLSPEEKNIIRQHVYYTEKTLILMGVDTNVVSWASNHHEKLNGTGYPKGLHAPELDFESRVLCALDVFQALTEDRPYRTAFPLDKAWDILDKMVMDNELDSEIVSIIKQIFS